MTKDTVLWAQALDNMSTDHIERSGKALSANQTSLRGNSVSRISQIVKSGSVVFKSPNVKLTVAGSSFVAEVTAEERDYAGRIAPIVFFATCGDEESKALANHVYKQVSDFATRIGRKVPPEHEELLLRAFTAAKKKRVRRTIHSAIVVIGIVAAVALAWWIVQRKL